MIIDHAEAQKAINQFAGKLMRRWGAGGAPYHLIEDIKQELWIALINAQSSYDETKGAAFKTYFYGAMQWHMRTWARENIHTRQQEIFAKSLDAQISEDGDTFAQIIPSADPAPEDIVIEENLWEAAMRLLKPQTRIFMELLRNPPDALLNEVRAIQARSNFAKSRGITSPFANRVTSRMVFDLLQINPAGRTQIFNEIDKVARTINRVHR